MKLTDKLAVFYHDRKVGDLMMTPDNIRCAFQYTKEWLATGQVSGLPGKERWK